MKTKRELTVQGTVLKKKRSQRVKRAAYATAMIATQVMAKAESSPCDVILPGIHWVW